MRMHLGIALKGYALDVNLGPDPDAEDESHDTALDSLVERADPDEVSERAELDARSPSRVGF